MTTYPNSPMQRFAGTVKNTGAETTRAHARLDTVESVQNKQTSDIATGSTNLAAAETRLGGSTHETYLGTLARMSHYNETNGGGWTSGGALAGGTWDGSHATALTNWMNQVNADIGAILSRLQSGNFMG